MSKVNKTESFFSKVFKKCTLAFLSLLFSVLILLSIFFSYLFLSLPDVSQLKDARLQVPLRVFTRDGKLIAEFGEKKRLPVKLKNVPKLLIHAILDTEDQRFFEHGGVDFVSLIRAAKTVFVSGRKSQGASTITMQVARNFFLNRDKTYARKLNEIVLALKIDQKLTKNEILELYINKIYLGQRAYGVAAAANLYYGKTLNQLDLQEIATIAGLPQAPSKNNPIVNPKAALERRNHVLTRMYENNHISKASYKAAMVSPLYVGRYERKMEVDAPYVAEMARLFVVSQIGDDVYDQGYNVYTTLDSRLQRLANQALHDGVTLYDRRHGYRGPLAKIKNIDRGNVVDACKKLGDFKDINGFSPAVVVNIEGKSITAIVKGCDVIHIACVDSFAKQALHSIEIGSVISVSKDQNGLWQVGQIPDVEAALVSINPQNGAILALVGGFSYKKSNFNRAIQSDRQTGSAFKPFVYSAALAKGFTLASIINDAPFVVSNRVSNTLWRPQNDTLRFYGPTRLRVGLTQSRNVVSIRLLKAIGIKHAISYLQLFGFEKDALPHNLSLALGTASLSPLQLASGYAVFANGGHRVTPYFIGEVKDQGGKVIFEANPPKVPYSRSQFEFQKDEQYKIKTQQDNVAPLVISPQNAYLMTDVLKDVIRRGTAFGANVLKRSDLAGKTGTTNNQNDAWFCGFNSDIVTATWLGFDKPQSLYEYGAQAALPMWIQFTGGALRGFPPHSFSEPDGIVTAKIDPKTGRLANLGQKNAIFEIFTKDNGPKQPLQDVSNDNDLFSTDVVDENNQEPAATYEGGGGVSNTDSQPLF